jgi:hypothetical protein
MSFQNTYEKITEYEVTPDTVVTFNWEDGADVFHYTDDHVDEAVSETGVINVLADLLADRENRVESLNEILSEMREEGMLEEYERGSHAFDEYLSDKICDEHWNFCWFEHSTKKYDHKRGHTTISMTFDATVEELKNKPYAFSGWEMEFTRKDGARITLG